MRFWVDQLFLGIYIKSLEYCRLTTTTTAVGNCLYLRVLLNMKMCEF